MKKLIRTAFTIVFILICIALIVVVLMQEGKSAGLGALTGQADSYVRKNHGRTREGRLERATVILGVLFFVIAIGLELKFFQ
ncbi:MAG TPA: preprotein translocase subunit SecG [Candidatus Anaerobutyricum stercoris]|uniref:Protein-export membrane protein SecG n=1 Tax=Candidatus Anaerobutyricum stercoris TaxID=2838457 RepID=A0A9D2J7B4_9FIRM|nr:preprotein translocase subunit SecG [Eubacterium sp. An3]HIZ38782.1 preprotein translocase subunit SecG [Candidatus Anaerobutyricum stercoris]